MIVGDQSLFDLRIDSQHSPTKAAVWVLALFEGDYSNCVEVTALILDGGSHSANELETERNFSLIW